MRKRGNHYKKGDDRISKIKVIDSMCGKGKTSWAIQYINEHPEKSFIYVTPLLNEVERIKSNTARKFVEPTFKGKRKIDDFNTLLCNGVNIATTHATFSNSNIETIRLLQQSGYVLILDEVIDVLVPYNSIAEGNAKIRNGDIKLLLEKNFIAIDEYGRVSWIGPSYDRDGYTYSEIERLAKRNNLLLINNSLFLWEFPSDIFKAFDEVYVLTYLFEGSQLCPFFEYHSMDYSKMNVANYAGTYRIVPYQKDDADVDLYKKLITFNTDEILNNYKKRGVLSSTWYKNNIQHKGTKEAKRLSNNLSNYFRNKCKAKVHQIMWTCPKEFKDKISKGGYIRIRKLTPEEGTLPDSEKKKLVSQLSCFVPCNARATNDFKDRDILAYCCNMFINPYVPDFFERKNVVFNEDAYALSSLIQWIWRSAIRDQKPIKLYIPALRMRTLFGDWLCR